MFNSKYIFYLLMCFSGFIYAVEDPMVLRIWRKELEANIGADLSDRGLTNLEAKAIAEALANNTNLLSIDLSMNNIGDEGAVRIIEALKNNSTLQSLDLSGNSDIGEKTAEALLNILKSNKSLRTLKLNNTKISQSEINNINRLVIRNERKLER